MRLLIIFSIVCCLLTGCRSVVRFSSNENETILPQQKELVISSIDKKVNTIHNKKSTSTHIKSKYSDKIVNEARRWIGTPYLYGGNTRKGIDCSGFVKNVYANIGVKLPRSSGEQYIFATAVKTPSIGDLVFFAKSKKINHVGIYIGDNTIIHASIIKGVTTQKLAKTSLEKTLVGYGRVI